MTNGARHVRTLAARLNIHSILLCSQALPYRACATELVPGSKATFSSQNSPKRMASQAPAVEGGFAPRRQSQGKAKRKAKIWSSRRRLQSDLFRSPLPNRLQPCRASSYFSASPTPPQAVNVTTARGKKSRTHSRGFQPQVLARSLLSNRLAGMRLASTELEY